MAHHAVSAGSCSHPCSKLYASPLAVPPKKPHFLVRASTLKTNGMVERFNGRIADVLKTNRFKGAEGTAQTLTQYVASYNHQFPQSALTSKTPMLAKKDGCATHPHPLHKHLYDHPKCDSYVVLDVREP